MRAAPRHQGGQAPVPCRGAAPSGCSGRAAAPGPAVPVLSPRERLRPGWRLPAALGVGSSCVLCVQRHVHVRVLPPGAVRIFCFFDNLGITYRRCLL